MALKSNRGLMPVFDAFPVIPGSKKPAVAWSQPGNLRPSTSFRQDEVYGVPTGPTNRIWVLDCDVGHKKDVNGIQSFQAYADEQHQEIPSTYCVRTKSGGLHFYFNWAAELEIRPIRNRAGVIPGVDVRGVGGFVCAGGPYTVINASPVADAPAWVIDLARKRSGGKAGEVPDVDGYPAEPLAKDDPLYDVKVGVATGYLESVQPLIADGTGHARLFDVARRLTRTYALPLDVAEKLFHDVLNPRCSPPWDETCWREVTDALKNAQAYGRDLTAKEVRAIDESFMGGKVEAPAPQQSAHGEVPGVSAVPGVPAVPAVPGSAGALVAGKVPTAPTGEVPVIDCNPENYRRRLNDGLPHHNYQQATKVHTDTGKPEKATCIQLAAVFTGPQAPVDWRGVFQYDQFLRRLVAVRPPIPLDAEESGLTESDLAKIQAWCASARNYAASAEQLRAAIDIAASCCSYHPVRAYLDGCVEEHPYDVESAHAYFDGIAGRLWGAPPDLDKEESAAVKRFAVAAVRRIRHPGEKVDTMLVLYGEQGAGKSRFCKKLFGNYFKDSMPGDLKSKDAALGLDGAWCIEFPEMVSLTRSGQNVQKEFLARSEDKYRPPYARNDVTRPRQTVFIGTTNEDDFLEDATGDRRYDVCALLRNIDLSFNEDQWWSAACALESAGFSHFVPVKEGGRSAADKSRFAYVDPWTDTVLNCCYAQVKKGEESAFVRAETVLSQGIVLDIGKQDRDATKRVTAILRRAFGASKPRWVDGRTVRAYLVKARQVEAPAEAPTVEPSA